MKTANNPWFQLGARDGVHGKSPRFQIKGDGTPFAVNGFPKGSKIPEAAAGESYLDGYDSTFTLKATKAA